MFKKLSFIILSLFLLTACATKEDQKKIIKVASHMEPMVDVVKIAAEEIKKEGYEIELVNVSDNIQANAALQEKSIDANFFQHEPFMQDFNESHDANLKAIAGIYDAIVGFYSHSIDRIEDLEKGMTVGIPNDYSNQARALDILDDHGIIRLKEGLDHSASLKDIEENPYELIFHELDLLSLTHAFEDVDLLYNYPTYIAKIGLKPKDDALLIENSDHYYAISLVAREDNQDSEEILALKKAMTSQAVKDFLEKEHHESLIPSF